jgi:transcription elongation factor GreB
MKGRCAGLPIRSISAYMTYEDRQIGTTSRISPGRLLEADLSQAKHVTMGTRTRSRPDESRKPGQITPEGYRSLQDQVDTLWAESRVVADAVAVAAAEGDRSENAEYTYSKMKLAAIHRKLGFLTRRLKALTVVPQPPPDDARVHFGCWVEIEDDEGAKHVYRIVGSDETDLALGHISAESPVARGLLGRELGDEVVIRRPRGKLNATVVGIFAREPASGQAKP